MSKLKIKYPITANFLPHRSGKLTPRWSKLDDWRRYHLWANGAVAI